MCVTNSVFLQFLGPWYAILHSSNDFENNIACHKISISNPVGNRSFMTSDLYVIRWVHNTHYIITVICGFKRFNF